MAVTPAGKGNGMRLPQALKERIDDALKALRASPTCELDPYFRLNIYDFFDSLPPLRGRLARTYLSNLAARRALPKWEERADWWDEYRAMPQVMLAAAEQLAARMQAGGTGADLDVMARSATIEELVGSNTLPHELRQSTLNELAAHAQEMDGLTGHLPASRYFLSWCVFKAAKDTLVEARGHGMSLARFTASDHARVYYEDGVGYAAIACSGGRWAPLDPALDELDRFYDPDDTDADGKWDYTAPDVLMKRHAFWEWWLLEIVPAVYGRVLSSDGGNTNQS